MRQIDEFEAFLLVAETGKDISEYRAIVIPEMGYMEIQRRNTVQGSGWHTVKYMPPATNPETLLLDDYMKRLQDWINDFSNR